MNRFILMSIALGGAVLFGGAALSANAFADSASARWAGPNGGSVEWYGRGVPGHYRGDVIVTTPDGRVFRRVTRAHRGPYRAFYSRKWIGPNGRIYGRRGVVRY